MSFELTNTLGWALFEVLTSAQVNDIDLKTSRAVDGHGGGVYAPSAPIEIGGAGLVVTGTLGIEGTVSFANLVTFEDDVEFNNDAVFNDPIIANSTGTFNGETTFNDDIHLNDDMNITGTFSVDGDVSFGDDLFIDDDCEVGGDLTVLGATDMRGDVSIGNNGSDSLSFHASLSNFLRYTGLGRIPLKSGGTLPNSNVTLTVEDGQVFRVDSDITADRTYTLSTSNAVDGDWMIFFSGGSTAGTMTNTALINSPTSGQDVTFSASETLQSAYYVFLDGDWWLINTVS